MVYSVAFAILAFAQVAFAAGGQVSYLYEAVSVGKNMSIGLNFTPSGNISNSNPLVASATVSGTSLLIQGTTVGTSVIRVCDAQNFDCLNVTVAVTGSVLGASTFFNTHPVGSWVLAGKTVFYVSNTGLIPVGSWQIFLGNGGQAKFIQPIMQGDYFLPLLPFMTANDNRVQ